MDLKIVCAIIYLIVVFLVCYYLYSRQYEHFINLTNRSDEYSDTNSYDIVLARYNEDISWIRKKPFSEFNIICYNKGSDDPERECLSPTCNIINLKNVGRQSHTYLYHIIKNYNKLSPVTIFLPASCNDPHKMSLVYGVIAKVLKTKTTVLRGDIGTYPDDLYDYTIDNWTSSNAKNKLANPESKLEPSPIRPFGKWFEQNFGDIKVPIFCHYDIFAVAKEHILQHPVSKYQSLIKYLENSSNPECGHYMERSWGAIFYPYPDSCVYDDYSPTNSVLVDV